MTKKFTIFGNPVEHSISPKMHTFAIEGLSLDATYTKTKLEDGTKLKSTFLENFDGANVTVPHKEIAFKLCDEVRGVAQDIKAVNTLINENGKMIGYNTDADGFLKSVEPFKDIKKVLILGAGGTAKALGVVFSKNDVKVTILNRSKNRLEFFNDFGIEAFFWDDFILSSYDLVINTTSAGLQDENFPVEEKLLKDIFSNTKFVADVIYNKSTPFLKLAKEMKLPTKDGADMLLYQGVLAFDIFYKHTCNTDKITNFMKKAFV